MADELKPCPFCGHHAYEPTRVKGREWGQWDWKIGCSSSHCRAEVNIVADGWKQQLDPNLNGHIPADELYDDRLLQLRRMWNRRALSAEPVAQPQPVAQEMVSVADIEAEIAHIKENGISLAKFGGDSKKEGRCRELCAMYLQEFIVTMRMGKRLIALQELATPPDERQARKEREDDIKAAIKAFNESDLHALSEALDRLGLSVRLAQRERG